MLGRLPSRSLNPPSLPWPCITDYKKRQGIVSETGVWARHLLTRVLPRLRAGGSLSESVRLAVIEARAHFASHNLLNIKQICSGADGGLGTKKTPRSSARKDGDAGGVADEGASGEPATGAAVEGNGPVPDDSESALGAVV